MGYTLVITEKPSAARIIANALAERQVVSHKKRGVFYYEFERDGQRHIVVPAAGHLYALNQKGKGWTYPVFDVEWTENYKANKNARYSKRFLLNIKDFADADEYIVATDFDVEGRIIAYNILRFSCGTEKARSMQFSTLTASDLIDAYYNASDDLEWGMINSGIARHFVDYYYGVNITRALTLALKKKSNFGFRVVSSGRVQAPTLNLLLEKEKQIKQFEPTSYWQIELHAEIDGQKITALHVEGRFLDEKKARAAVENCQGGTPQISKILRGKYRQKPPTPFNITDLQTEAYQFFRYTPIRTQDIAQSLYSEGWISYPRTSSQELPEKIGYDKILKALTQLKVYRTLATDLLQRTRLWPREGEKRDPAHVAIYPTHQPPTRMPKGSKGKLYDLICRRFLSTFAEPAVLETLKATIHVNQEAFQIQGQRTVERNWHRFYEPYVRFKETRLPHLVEGAYLTLKEVKLLKKQTNPPPRYTPASLVKILEAKELGTKATRAQIVRTLYDRGYLKGNRIEVTPLGETVVQILEAYCPKIISEALTRETEQNMNLVRQRKLKKEEVIQQAQQVLTEILTVFKTRENEIGERLAAALTRAQQASSLLGKCPQCGNHLRIIYSKKTHLRFAGCEGYFKGVCDFSSPLPQKNIVQPTQTACKYCDYPLVKVYRKGRRRLWLLCINTECPNKQLAIR